MGTDRVKALELMLLGAMMANMKVREKVNPQSFQDGDIKACALDLLAVDHKADRDIPYILNQYLLKLGVECDKNPISEIIKHVDKIGQLAILRSASQTLAMTSSGDVRTKLVELRDQINNYLD